MQNWWENLPIREKQALAGGALGLLLLLGYLLVHPLLAKRAQLRAEVDNRRAELAWMRDAAREIGSSGAATPNGGGATPPLQFIDQAARENHLSDQLKRVEPGANGEIKVWLSNAAYVDLVRWLRQLSSTGRLVISNLNVEKGAAPGQVNAQLTLNSSGAP